MACSVRDILVQQNDPQRLQEIVDLIRAALRSGAGPWRSRLCEFAPTFAAAAEIAAQMRYTGYVVGELPARLPPSARQDVVLVSAGGGAVGAPLLQAALAARPLTQRRDALGHVITGPNLPEHDFRSLAERRRRQAAHRAFSRRFSAAARLCRVSVSQAGYNTVMEILAVGARAVVVPFADGQESEQPVRARLLAERGLVQVVAPQDLTPVLLAAAIDGAAAMPAPSEGLFNLKGAAATAEILHQALRQRLIA